MATLESSGRPLSFSTLCTAMSFDSILWCALPIVSPFAASTAISIPPRYWQHAHECRCGSFDLGTNGHLDRRVSAPHGSCVCVCASIELKRERARRRAVILQSHGSEMYKLFVAREYRRLACTSHCGWLYIYISQGNQSRPRDSR
jgi:hypothetical protein